MQDEKWIQYAAKISNCLGELFEEDSQHYLGKMTDEDLTDFFHALANVVPTSVFNKITGNKKNHLHFNHIANQLVFQYSKKGDETEEV